MKIRIDECGDFDFSNEDRFRVAVVAGVVIPDDRWPGVEAWIAAQNQTRGERELKARSLGDSELVEAVEFLRAEELVAGAIVTDSRIFPHEQQVNWRRRQFRSSKHPPQGHTGPEKTPRSRQKSRGSGGG